MASPMQPAPLHRRTRCTQFRSLPPFITRWVSTVVQGGSVAALLFALPIIAQPTPKLDSISREWIQRGTTVEVTFTGTNLAAVNRFVFDGEDGLSATNIPAAEPAKPAVTVE